MKKNLRRNLFYLFAGWSGKFGHPFESSHHMKGSVSEQPTDFELSALESMISVLCCGPCFDDLDLIEGESLYTFLNSMLESNNPRVIRSNSAHLLSKYVYKKFRNTLFYGRSKANSAKNRGIIILLGVFEHGVQFCWPRLLPCSPYREFCPLCLRCHLRRGRSPVSVDFLASRVR